MGVSKEDEISLINQTEDTMDLKIQPGEDDVFRFYENGSKILFVWFGGMREPFFGKSYADQSGFDCLYLKDAGFDWYTRGIVGAAVDVHQSVDWLKDFISQKYDFVCFCGQSSGGYAALYYGLLCSVNLCVVFAPQTNNAECHHMCTLLICTRHTLDIQVLPK
jgi:hypothetical protein